MSVLPVGFGSSGGLQITNSVRLRAAASAYFSRTFGAPTSQNVWTWSGWVKVAKQDVYHTLIGNNNTQPWESVWIRGDTQQIQVSATTASGVDTLSKISSMTLRDPSAWYHIVIQKNAAANSGLTCYKLYVNGSEITSWATNAYGGTQALVPNYINVSGVTGQIGRTSSYSDCYMSEIHFIDGQALTPSSFGETNADGVWVPKAYTGTYGTNGFHLDFKDAALTAGSNVGLGKDVSGNGNYWTTNNISVTAGVTYDSMVDTPTNNYATLNPLDHLASQTATDGSLTFNNNTAWAGFMRATQGITSGKWYWEIQDQLAGAGTLNYALVGICTSAANVSADPTGQSTVWAYYGNTGNKYNGSGSAYGATFTSTDVVGVAFDADAGTLTYYKNNTTQGQAFSGLTSGPYFPMFDYYSANSGSFKVNFGQRPFTYTPPTGYKALCTANLPAVAITKPALHFDTNTRTGTAATYNVTGKAFQPDFVWLKARSNVQDHILYDAVRGVQKRLYSDTTAAEDTDVNGLTSFNSDGFTYGSGSGNTSSYTYIDWMWKANGAGASNTAGSITSTVSANQTAGFSIVAYTGTGANATVGHGLGVAPKMIIIKQRDVAGNEWCVYNSNLSTPGTAYIFLNSTAAVGGPLATIWNSTNPTSSVFSIGTIAQVNQSTKLYVAYCFAEIAGYSKFGSYVGNGSADGPFVYCGFRPKYVMIKVTDSSYPWMLIDVARNTYNVAANYLLANAADAEGTSTALDFVANGFKHRTTGAYTNAANTYIFAAFAEHPFGGSNVSPSPAR